MEVLFSAILENPGAAGGPVFIVFDNLPDHPVGEDGFPDTGTFCVGEALDEGDCADFAEVGVQYPVDQVFRFRARFSDECSSCTVAEGDLVFHLVGPGGTSPSVVVPITVCAFDGCGGEELATTSSGNRNGSRGVGGGNESASRATVTSRRPRRPPPQTRR